MFRTAAIAGLWKAKAQSTVPSRKPWPERAGKGDPTINREAWIIQMGFSCMRPDWAGSGSRCGDAWGRGCTREEAAEAAKCRAFHRAARSRKNGWRRRSGRERVGGRPGNRGSCRVAKERGRCASDKSVADLPEFWRSDLSFDKRSPNCCQQAERLSRLAGCGKWRWSCRCRFPSAER